MPDKALVIPAQIRPDSQVSNMSVSIENTPPRKSPSVKPASTVENIASTMPVGNGGIGKSWQSRFRLTAKATAMAMLPFGWLTVPDANWDLLPEPIRISTRSAFGSPTYSNGRAPPLTMQYVSLDRATS